MTSAIQARGLTKRYGAAVALDRLDLDIGKGEVYAYLGPNGAGKTTTIRIGFRLCCTDSSSAAGVDIG